MFPCWWIGRLVGALAVHTVETQVREYKLARPIPSDYEMSSDVEVLDDDEEASLDELSPNDNNSASTGSSKVTANS
ncbi:MAG: hypothetical protein CMJ19_20685 [Phycisphaeraceae bacterium]|nr:hypothetical protein [Phycisphaeraceae bacterium]